MADFRWTGAVSTDADTAGNWADGTPPEGVIVGGDNIFVLSTAVNDMLLNIDWTDEDTNGYRAGTIYIQEGCNVQVGATGAPLKCSTAKLIHRGNKALHFQASEGTSSLADTTDVAINSPNMTLAAVIDDDGAQKITNIQITQGAVSLAADMQAISNVTVATLGAAGTAANVTINASSNNITILILMGGTVSSARPALTAWIAAGDLTYTSASSVVITQYGGQYNHEASADISSLVALGGDTDLSGVTDFITITDLFEGPGANVIKSDELVAVTNDHPFGIDND